MLASTFSAGSATPTGGNSWFGDLLGAASDSFSTYLGYKEKTATAKTPPPQTTVQWADPFSSGGNNYQTIMLFLGAAGLAVAVLALFWKR